MNVSSKFIAVVLSFVAILANAQVQDVSFSQYFNFPALQDPAFAGNSSADYRIAGIYRQQWKAIEAEFLTYGIAGDLTIAENPFGKGNFGLGFYAVDDHLGNDIIKNQEAGLSLAFHRPLDFQERHRVSLGVNFNYSSSSINYDLLTFESQYNDFILDTESPTGETFENDQIKNINIGFGLGYTLIINTKNKLKVGVALSELMAPKEYFISSNSEAKLNNKWVTSSSLRHQLSARVALIPSIQVISFQNVSDLRIGTVSAFSGFKNFDLQLEGGVFYQLKKAITLYGGVKYRDYSVHASYDFTASSLNNVADVSDQNFKKPGALEISVIMTGFTKNRDKYAVPCKFF